MSTCWTHRGTVNISVMASEYMVLHILPPTCSVAAVKVILYRTGIRKGPIKMSETYADCKTWETSTLAHNKLYGKCAIRKHDCFHWAQTTFFGPHVLPPVTKMRSRHQALIMQHTDQLMVQRYSMRNETSCGKEKNPRASQRLRSPAQRNQSSGGFNE